jgi:DNA-binding GntR family transcriptional regulator
MMNKKVPNIPLTANAYSKIKQQIIDLHLKPGQIILAQNLSNDLGISRTPIREALVRLTQEGLVEHAEGRKFRISEITLKNILEIYEIREALEIAAVRDISKKIRPEHIDTIETIMREMRNALEAQDFDKFFKLDLDFHSVFLEVHGNQTMIKVLERLYDQIQRIRYLTMNLEGRTSHTIDEHELILRNLKKRDPQKVGDAIHSHFENVRKDFEKLSEGVGKHYFLWKSLVT